ncbi:thiamine pyrophosphate-binding protein [Halobacteriales archaeon Cl-PHB]
MSSADTGATVAARTLSDLSDRVFGLCGGHIQPIWDAVADTHVDLVDVRDERVAVHAAHGHATVSDGLGVAMVTAGPGFTNAMTGIVNAYTSGVPVLVVTGRPPTPQFDRGALQGTPHRDIAEDVTVMDRTAFEADRIRDHLVEAAGAALEERGPAVVEVPTDVLRDVPQVVSDRPAPSEPTDVAADDASLDRAADVLSTADQPAVILGRGARSAAEAVRSFVDEGELPVLPTAGSKGVVPTTDPYCLPGARGVVMDQADTFLLLGKRMDFTFGYGSEAVFGDAQFIQFDVDAAALHANRTPDVAVRGTVASAVDGLAARVDGPLADTDWVGSLQDSHADRADRLAEQKQADEEPLHPYRVCGAIEQAVGDDTVIVCDGGDSLSFGRVALNASGPGRYLDPGPLGCLGVGVPFGISAALAEPEADVVTFTGDGSLGFNLADIETAAREEADLTIVVANNAAWNIERYDQVENYGREVGVRLQDVAFDQVAEGLGATGMSVSGIDDLDETVAAAIETDGPVVVDVPVDDDAVSPDARNGLARVPTFQPLDYWEQKEREFRDLD